MTNGLTDESIRKAEELLEDLSKTYTEDHEQTICFHAAVVRYVASLYESNQSLLNLSQSVFRQVVADYNDNPRPNNYDPRFRDFIGYTDHPSSPNYNPNLNAPRYHKTFVHEKTIVTYYCYDRNHFADMDAQLTALLSANPDVDLRKYAGQLPGAIVDIDRQTKKQPVPEKQKHHGFLNTNNLYVGDSDE